jgi:hypothetical protein
MMGEQMCPADHYGRVKCKVLYVKNNLIEKLEFNYQLTNKFMQKHMLALICFTNCLDN